MNGLLSAADRSADMPKGGASQDSLAKIRPFSSCNMLDNNGRRTWVCETQGLKSPNCPPTLVENIDGDLK